MYSQLFNLLCDKADDVYNGRLPIHVRRLLDEFANIWQIPQFEKLIATIRSREISASIIMDFSLLSPLEFFVDPKNVDGRNNKPPAMRVRVDCYTKKLPFRVQ